MVFGSDVCKMVLVQRRFVMAGKKFTEEEMGILRASPHVVDVNPNFLYITAEFKELFWMALQAGEQPRDIVAGFGIDPDILGESRLGGMVSSIKREGKAGKGFKDMSASRLDVRKCVNPEVKIKYLEQQLAYKNQEIEFLKKIVLLGQEGPGL
jgi:hypothetical protein